MSECKNIDLDIRYILNRDLCNMPDKDRTIENWFSKFSDDPHRSITKEVLIDLINAQTSTLKPNL